MTFCRGECACVRACTSSCWFMSSYKLLAQEMQRATDLQPQIVDERRLHVGEGRRRRRARRCGVCQGCIREDCGQCRNCKDKVKFGGPGTKKQRCVLRACANMMQKMSSRRYSEEEEKDLTSFKITCVFCGRKRKKGLSRSAFFCTKHCQTRWQDSHPGELPIQASEICDEDESVTAFFLEAAFSKEPFCRDEITTNCSSSNKMEGETVLPLKDSEETVVVCPQVLLSSNAYPGTLSPSPTPLSSPTLYTLPASHSTGNKLKIDKWKAIIRKLSLHNELRSVWNELKVRGGFSTNEDFIIHLLRCEAERQCIEYDVLASKPPPDVSDVTKYGVDTPSDMASSPEVSVNLESDTLSCKTDTVTDIHCNSVGFLQKDSTGAAEYASELSTLCQRPDCSSRQYELTVLDSQKKHAKDETDLEFPVDEVIDFL